MVSIQLTPFLLFSILLIILVISVLFGQYYQQKEGFTVLDKINKQPPQTPVILSVYSPTQPIYTIYPGIFFDKPTGNLIEFMPSFNGDSNSQKNASDDDIALYITSRNKKRAAYSGISTSAVAESLNIPKEEDYSNYDSWSVKTDDVTVAQKQIFYIGWGLNTYIHILHVGGFDFPFHMGTYKFDLKAPYIDPKTSNKQYLQADQIFALARSSDQDIVDYMRRITEEEGLVLMTNAITTKISDGDNDANKNTMIFNNDYDPSVSVFCLSAFIQFDLTNGNIIMLNKSTVPTQFYVYDRTGTKTGPWAIGATSGP